MILDTLAELERVAMNEERKQKDDQIKAIQAELAAARDEHQASDPVNHPDHYTSHPSGIECIEVTRHMGFNLGNVIKYCWRAGLKANPNEDELAAEIRDLEKAHWYLSDEIERLKGKQDK